MAANIVVLHLGIHKTGSSSIQATLYDVKNRAILREEWIYIVSSLPENQSAFFQSAFSERPELYHANVRDQLSLEEIRRRVKGQIARVRNELAGLTGSTVVFTGEDGCVLSGAGLCKLKEFLIDVVPRVAKIKVVVYTREPVSYAESAIQENVKGNGHSLASAKPIHIGATAGRYQKLYERLSRVFGEGCVVFRSFEGAVAVHGGVVEDFATAIGTSAEGIRIVKKNEAVCDEVVRILSVLNERGIVIGQKDKAILFDLPGCRGTLLNDSEVGEVVSAGASDMEFLRKRFGINYSMDKRHSREKINPFGKTFCDEVQRVFGQIDGRVADVIDAMIVE